MNRTLLSTSGLGLALLLFLLVNMISNASLSGVRVDLTENGLFSLSDGSRRLAAGLSEPVSLRFYFSEKQATDIPTLRTYADRVEGLLREFATASGGRIRFEKLDPEPFSETEDQAVQAGLQGLLLESGDVLYFGMVASGSTDERSVVPFFDPAREQSLEYEVARVIYRLGRPDKPVVAVLSTLPLQGRPAMPFPGAPPGEEPWFIHEQLNEVFDVRTVDPIAAEIPEDTDVLLVVHPKDLPEETLFAIDQFVLGGGHTMILVDPHCEADRPPQDPNNPLASMMAPRASNLDRLFRAWGFEMVPDRVLGDRNLALRVRTGNPAQPEEVDYVLWLGLGAENLDEEDLVTARLGQMNVVSAGILQPLQGATTVFHPILLSTEDAMRVEVAKVQFMPDPKRLLTEYVPLGERQVIAARVSGDVESAFPDGPPGAMPGEEPADEPAGGWLRRSVEPIQLLVVADADLLADDWWVRMQSFFGSRLAVPTASNGDFVIHALDNLSGSDELLAVPSRARFERPFRRIDEIRRLAEQRYLLEEQELQAKLRETERRLTELQRQKEDAGSLILSPEQREEIERFREEQVVTRKALRDVQHDLRKDIERLETHVKIVNIGLMPVLIGLVAMGLGAWRRRRQGG